MQSLPYNRPQRPRGEWRYSSTLSLTFAVDGVGGQRHASPIYPRERPGTHCIGGLMGPQVRSGRVRGHSRPHRLSIPGPFNR